MVHVLKKIHLIRFFMQSYASKYVHFLYIITFLDSLLEGLQALEESLSITTGRCDLAIATHPRKMHKK
jgi:hypothetical protein